MLRIVLVLIGMTAGSILPGYQGVSAGCPVAPGDWDYCNLCGPCQSGQGDCDTDSDCISGLTCQEDVGPAYGLANGIDVCVGTAADDTQDPEPADDPEEPALDCTGLALILDPRCQVVDPVDPAPDDGNSGCAFDVGHPSYCFSCGPCTEGQGGCNRNYQCADGLICDLTTNICVRAE